MRCPSLQPHPAAPGAARPAWTTVATHTHFLRNPKVGDAESLANLLAWERRHNIGAIGLGSPWTPRSAALYHRYEHEDRDRYFAGLLTDAERAEVLCRDDLAALLRRANAAVATGVRLLPGESTGAPFRLLAADGSEIRRGRVPTLPLSFDAPATARLEIERPGGAPPRVLPLAAANRRVRALMDYLADGLFLRDFPGLKPGEVPVDAFRLDDVRTALETLELTA